LIDLHHVIMTETLAILIQEILSMHVNTTDIELMKEITQIATGIVTEIGKGIETRTGIKTEIEIVMTIDTNVKERKIQTQGRETDIEVPTNKYFK